MPNDIFLLGPCLLISVAFSVGMAPKGWLLVGEGLKRTLPAV